jgi:hypothetical protein
MTVQSKPVLLKNVVHVRHQVRHSFATAEAASKGGSPLGDGG